VPADRQFTVTEDLINAANITANINADISGMSSGTPLYAYTSMYIVMRSFDPQTLTPVYSSPTFINIFMLPSNIPVTSVTGVSVTSSNATANPTVRLTALVTPENATNTDVNWTFSDTSIAGYRDAGDKNTIIVYSVVSSGNVTVTAKTVDGGHTASLDVPLSGYAVTALTLNNQAITLTNGGSSNLVATIEPKNALNNVEWVSSNKDVVAVSASSGASVTITARSVGTAVITATDDYTELSATCTVIVQ
jgi:uncharacterized protein YjdB